MKYLAALLLSATLLISSCTVNRKYTIQRYKTDHPAVIITGAVYDKKTKKKMPAVRIMSLMDSMKVNTDNDGNYTLKSTVGSQKLKAIWVGYYDVNTKKIMLNRGDSLMIDFYMKEDNRPLID
ncbi:carboxypeptidase-like regulatory domain-containing protein [Pedobacter sp. BMA]|uniref:carboxypeptidase-like regulatory domain-containing protein n=1 Tax=Pedobacter sp. BMA TaxID=1663685 RepID=UPI000649DBC1|nr:carboxypeptidase-like regulatory domain-containing protein [Pedobacter sp. BMA]KLT67016.1 hypothetical protein AB669_03610 [Pedobacter sp. BMA]